LTKKPAVQPLQSTNVGDPLLQFSILWLSGMFCTSVVLQSLQLHEPASAQICPFPHSGQDAHVLSINPFPSHGGDTILPLGQLIQVLHVRPSSYRLVPSQSSIYCPSSHEAQFLQLGVFAIPLPLHFARPYCPTAHGPHGVQEACKEVALQEEDVYMPNGVSVALFCSTQSEHRAHVFCSAPATHKSVRKVPFGHAAQSWHEAVS
jgi:hypothetical protein